MQHASAQNVVEWIFGVMKKHWGILTQPSQFSMAIQAQIPPALATTHNFIMDHDPHDIEEHLTGNNEDDLNPNPGQLIANEFRMLADGAVTQAEKERATDNRDGIAQAMWDNYQATL